MQNKPMIHLLCHLNDITFSSDIKRKSWLEGCKTLLRQTSLNKGLLFILPGPLECFITKTLCTDDGQTVLLYAKKDI